MAFGLRDAALNDEIKVKGADHFKTALSPVIGVRLWDIMHHDSL